MTFAYYSVVFLVIVVISLFLQKKGFKYQVSSSAIILMISIFIYNTFFEQMIVKQYGGTMSVDIPDGAQFMNVTWKDNDVWLLWHDPVSGNCVFKEESKRGLLQGKIIINNCNPR